MPEISITAEPLTGPRCSFRVSRPVALDQWAYTVDRQSARGSPLEYRPDCCKNIWLMGEDW